MALSARHVAQGRRLSLFGPPACTVTNLHRVRNQIMIRLLTMKVPIHHRDFWDLFASRSHVKDSMGCANRIEATDRSRSDQFHTGRDRWLTDSQNPGRCPSVACAFALRFIPMVKLVAGFAPTSSMAGISQSNIFPALRAT